MPSCAPSRDDYFSSSFFCLLLTAADRPARQYVVLVVRSSSYSNQANADSSMFLFLLICLLLLFLLIVSELLFYSIIISFVDLNIEIHLHDFWIDPVVVKPRKMYRSDRASPIPIDSQLRLGPDDLENEVTESSTPELNLLLVSFIINENRNSSINQ